MPQNVRFDVDEQESERPLFQTLPRDHEWAAENVHRKGSNATKADGHFGRKRPPKIEKPQYFSSDRLIIPETYPRKNDGAECVHRKAAMEKIIGRKRPPQVPRPWAASCAHPVDISPKPSTGPPITSTESAETVHRIRRFRPPQTQQVPMNIGGSAREQRTDSEQREQRWTLPNSTSKTSPRRREWLARVQAAILGSPEAV
jgi:hypothetical protein